MSTEIMMKENSEKYMLVLGVVMIFLSGCKISSSQNKVNLGLEGNSVIKETISSSSENEENSQVECFSSTSNQEIVINRTTNESGISYPIFSNIPNELLINDSVIKKVSDLGKDVNVTGYTNSDLFFLLMMITFQSFLREKRLVAHTQDQ